MAETSPKGNYGGAVSVKCASKQDHLLHVWLWKAGGGVHMWGVKGGRGGEGGGGAGIIVCVVWCYNKPTASALK